MLTDVNIAMMNIKDVRQKLGLTQEQLAHKIGVTAFTIRRWESGKVKPSPLALLAIESSLRTNNGSVTPRQKLSGGRQGGLIHRLVGWVRRIIKGG